MPKRIWLLCVVLVIGVTLPLRADEGFLGKLTPEERAAAGLDQLSAAQQAKLDALVAQYKAGELDRAREEIRTHARAEAKQEVRTEVEKQIRAEAKQEVRAEVEQTVRTEAKEQARADIEKENHSKSFLERAKVLLKPGTEIEYDVLETAIEPPFRGWEKGTVFILANGQRWQVTENDRFWSRTINTPVKAKIVPGSLGSFFMEIDHGGRPRVIFLKPVVH